MVEKPMDEAHGHSSLAMYEEVAQRAMVVEASDRFR
jgi:hypothetical protein